MYNTNFLINQLREASLAHPKRQFAELEDGRTVTYSELFENAEKMATVFIKKGLSPNDRVMVQVEKSIQAIELYLAVILAGGIFLPLNTAYTHTELEYFLSDAKPYILICDPYNKEDLKLIAKEAGVETILTLAKNGKGSLTDLSSKEDSGFTGIARSKEDIASIIYTSGTTGRSKGAMLTHSNILSNAITLMNYWQFSKNDILIHSLPIFHVHGLFVAINVTLIAGSSIIFHQKFDANLILSNLPRATVLMGVPTFYVRLLGLDGLNQEVTKTMRLFISGSAPMLAETHRNWSNRTNHSIIERYGMTETNMNTSNPYDGERRAGTVGFPLPDIEVIVADRENGQKLKNGEVGSIEIRGPNVFKGYWKMPEKTAEEIRESGFFITGDLGRYDDEGYLTIVGRSKDLVISGGYNIYPKELELIIDDIDGVDESAVIGLPDTDFGESIAAVITLKKGANLTHQDILQNLKTKIASFKQPRSIFFIDELPRNTMGKIQKNILRETYKKI